MLLIFPATSGVPDQVGRASYVSKPADDSVRCVSVWPQVSEDRRRQWADVRRVLWPHRVRIIALGGSSFATGAVETALLVVITRVGLAIAEDDPSFGVLAGLSMSVEGALTLAGVLVLARLLLALLSMRLTVSLTTRVGTAARREMADAYLHTSWATQQTEPVGRLQELLVSFAGSTEGAANAFATSLKAALSLAALFIGSLLINPAATLVVVVGLAVLGSVLAPVRRRIRSRSRAAARAQVAFASNVAELGRLGMEMQSYGVRDQFSERVNNLISDHQNWRAKAGIAQGMINPIYAGLAFAALVGGLALASVVSPGELDGAAAVMLVMLRSLSYGQVLQSSSGTLAGLAPFLETMREMADKYRATPAELGQRPIHEVGSIRADQVSFSYVEGREVLNDISFEVAPGEIVGVVGPSGGGKSTLVQLLLGLRNPTDGRILIDGVDLRSIDRRSWSARTAFVAQDPNLHTGTVADNIGFFRPEIDMERIERAATDANVLADIQAMSDGFGTDVGERGTNLSGGQRQRVSIARALAGRPDLLVMDEPTSALDVRSEQLIRATVAALKGRVTVVIIAHRLSTLDDCDRIMVVEEGRLKAMAPRSELSRDNEFFRRSLELSGLRP